MRLVLRGGIVVDGTGGAARPADVEVIDGRITQVESGLSTAGADVVELDGLTLSPGFVDVHTHFDAQIFWDGDLTPSSWHGVTSVIAGNCGFGIAPMWPEDREAIIETLEFVEGMNAKTLAAGIDWCFESFPEYLDALRARPKRLNVGVYLGHTPLRTYVLGADASTSRAATPDEIAEMRRLVAEAMDAGAAGFSTSFAPSHNGYRGRPVPSRLAEVGELQALAGAVADSGRGIVEITYGPQMTIDDAARFANEVGVRVTWGALLTGLFGEHGAAVEMLERARQVSADIWPQISSREIVFLMSLEDPYFFGEVPAFKEVLATPRERRAEVYADPAWRERAKERVLDFRPGAYERGSFAETDSHPELIGKTLAQAAAELGVHPFDLWCDVAIEDGLATRFRIVSRNEDEVELAQLMRDHRAVLGAHDAGAHVDMLCDANFPSLLLGQWVRDKQALTLEEAIWRLSGQPAELWRLEGRGRIAPGYAADLVAFDPATIGASHNKRVYDFPAGGDRLVSTSTGIHHIAVNGTFIRRDGDDVAGAAPGVIVPDRV